MNDQPKIFYQPEPLRQRIPIPIPLCKSVVSGLASMFDMNETIMVKSQIRIEMFITEDLAHGWVTISVLPPPVEANDLDDEDDNFDDSVIPPSPPDYPDELIPDDDCALCKGRYECCD